MHEDVLNTGAFRKAYKMFNIKNACSCLGLELCDFIFVSFQSTSVSLSTIFSWELSRVSEENIHMTIITGLISSTPNLLSCVCIMNCCILAIFLADRLLSHVRHVSASQGHRHCVRLQRLIKAGRCKCVWRCWCVAHVAPSRPTSQPLKISINSNLLFQSPRVGVKKKAKHSQVFQQSTLDLCGKYERS